MAITQVGRVMMDEAAFGTFAATRYLELDAPPKLDSLKRTAFPNTRLRHRMGRDASHIGHTSEATLSIEPYLRSWYAPSAIAPVPTVGPVVGNVQPEHLLLAQALGNYRLWDAGSGAAFTTCTAIAGAGNVTLTVLSVAGYAVGDAVGLWTNNGVSDRWETGIITSLTVVPAITMTLQAGFANSLPGKVAGGSTEVYSGIMFYPTNFAFGRTNPLCFGILGQLAEDYVRVISARPTSCSLDLTPKALAKMSMALGMAHFDRPGTGGAPAYLAASTYPRQQVMSGALRVVPFGGVLTEFDTNDASLDLGLKTEQRGNPNSLLGGVADIQCVDRNPRLTLKPTWAIAQYTNFVAQTSYNVRCQFGNGPGQTILVSIPAGRIPEECFDEDANGIKTNNLIFEANEYVGDVPTGGGSGTDDGTDADNIDKCITIAVL